MNVGMFHCFQQVSSLTVSSFEDFENLLGCVRISNVSLIMVLLVIQSSIGLVLSTSTR